MIYLLRHGDAEPGNGDDPVRRLTAKGERQAKAAGEALAELGANIDTCLTSPKARDLIPCGVTSATIALREASNIDQPTKPWPADTIRYPAKSPTSENAKKLAELPARAASITGLRP